MAGVTFSLHIAYPLLTLAHPHYLRGSLVISCCVLYSTLKFFVLKIELGENLMPVQCVGMSRRQYAASGNLGGLVATELMNWLDVG